MSRYELLRKKNSNSGVKCFKPTKNVVDLYNILEDCLKRQYILQADNLSPGLLNPALIRLSRKYCYPIVVASKELAKSLSISHAYARVYSIDDLPEKYAAVVCYEVSERLLPVGFDPVLIIRRGDNEPV